MDSSNANYQSYRNHGARSKHFLPEDFSGAKVIDFGSNGGDFLTQARRWGAMAVVGVDIDPAFRTVPHTLIANLDEPDIWSHAKIQTCDVALVLALLQWLKDPFTFMERVGRITKNVIYVESHQPQYDRLKPEDYTRAFNATGFTVTIQRGTVDQGRILWRLTR